MTVMRWIQRQTQRLTVIAAGLLIIGIGGRFLPWLWVRPVALTLAAIVAGLPIGLRAWGALRARVISIELLVSLAAIGALIIGEVSEAAIVTFLFLFGSWLEEKTLAKTRRSIKTLTAMAPTQAWVVHEGGEPVATDVDDVEEGDVVLVKTGGQVPVDGVIMNGTGYLNEASVTGEAKLVEKTVGANVYAGTMLDNGTLTVQATRVGEETTFGKIVELVENAQDAKSPVEQFIDRFATYYTPAVLVLAVLVGVVFKDVRLAITVMVLGCPGALVIGAPVSNVAGIGNGAQHGVLIKGGDVMDTLSRVDALAVDKTGTLTKGATVVTSVKRYDEKASQRALQLAAMAEQASFHPLAQALITYVTKQKWDNEPGHVTAVETVKGQGLVAQADGQPLVIGSEALLVQHGVQLSSAQQADIMAAQQAGQSTVLVAVAGELQVLVGIADELREDVVVSLKQLRQLGIKQVVMLTGDNERTAAAIGQQAGVDVVQANLLPEEKVAAVQALQSAGHTVAFVGDGINDSPSLAVADIGIAVGSGTDVAVETSAVVLMKGSFAELVHAYGLAKRVVANTRENIVVAVATVALLLGGLVAGKIYMASGMLIHEVSILVVILNAMRLISRKPHKKGQKLDARQVTGDTSSVH